MINLDNGMDIIDMMGDQATREDYAWLAQELQKMADDDEMWAVTED
jgi:hypothetical protein